MTRKKLGNRGIFIDAIVGAETQPQKSQDPILIGASRPPVRPCVGGRCRLQMRRNKSERDTAVVAMMRCSKINRGVGELPRLSVVIRLSSITGLPWLLFSGEGALSTLAKKSLVVAFHFPLSHWTGFPCEIDPVETARRESPTAGLGTGHAIWTV